MELIRFDGRFWLIAALVAAVSYLIGSVSFAVIVSRIGAQDDVRIHGSGNAGMTNILRTYGKKLAFFTAIGDFGKGIVAVALGRMVFGLADIHSFDGGYIAGLFVILGHLYPLFFGFKGGKGVLTGLGVVLVLNWRVFLIITVLLVPVVFKIKIVSLTVLIGYTLFPIFTVLVDWWMGRNILFNLFFSLIISVIGIYKHRENIKRLRAGTEYKFGQK
ncbi:MAG: glycerol-3-phosphate 1-O-acyltransferase PlsY [Anaerotruncus sp.]|jgi:glycerol-3-phosphate acyltransferase PlsY|nr:glycerol-3-phosphate 1-O-acyltransferase PlsY [Anaerotruncus sp.]